MGLETAAIIGLGSMAAQGIGAGFSFAQANKQKRELDKANKAAQKAIAEAKALTDINQLESLQVPLEPYRTAMREGTAQQMQSLQALQEADARSLAAGVGKIGAVGTDYLERVRNKMSQDIYANDLLKAKEEARLQDQKLDISQLEAEGAQQASADAQKFRNQAITQGVQGIAGAAITGLSSLPEYPEDKDLAKFLKAKESADLLTRGALGQNNYASILGKNVIATALDNPVITDGTSKPDEYWGEIGTYSRSQLLEMLRKYKP